MTIKAVTAAVDIINYESILYNKYSLVIKIMLICIIVNINTILVPLLLLERRS